MSIPGKRVLKMVYWSLLTVVLLFFIRAFFFDVYKIPSDSMKNSFKTGDHIFVNKTNTGPELNEIFVYTINKNIPGFFVKRCVGLPGDTIEIKNGVVIINNQELPEPSSIRHYYKIWFNDYSLIRNSIEKANVDKQGNAFRRFPEFIITGLDNSQKKEIINHIDSMTIFNAPGEPENKKINIPGIHENILNMPMIIIPFKGMKILVNEHTSSVYVDAIRNYEDPSFHQTGEYYYIFKQDYFFMMGDNRDIAIDSRHYGLIPKKNLIGKYIFKL